jgi:hypothetical protein
LDRAETDKEKGAIQKKLDDVLKQLERSVAVYGMISLRADGEKAIVTQKLAKPISNRGSGIFTNLNLGLTDVCDPFPNKPEESS